MVRTFLDELANGTSTYRSLHNLTERLEDDFYPPTINDPIYFTREQHWVVERDNGFTSS